MNDYQLFQAVGEIDDDILKDTDAFLTGGRKKPAFVRPARWAALAACFLLVVTAVLSWPRREAVLPADTTEPPASDGGSDVGTHPVGLSAIADIHINALSSMDGTVGIGNNFNQAPEGAGAIGSYFALLWEDFIPMTCEEILDHFHVELPVEDALPGLKLTDNGGFGIYQTDARGIYHDANLFDFSDGTRHFKVSLSTGGAWIWADLDAGPLEFTRLNGWDLVLFCRTDEGGMLCYFTEFMQNGIRFSVTAQGLTEEDFARGLLAILEEKPAADGPVTVHGTVNFVDDRVMFYYDLNGLISREEQHDFISFHMEDGQGYTVWLPGEANMYAVGDRVTVTFTGEPATIQNIWPGQLESVTKE